MSPNPVKTNRSIVNLLWQQNIRTPKEISSKTGIPLRTCQRYVSLLKKSGKLHEIHKSGSPRNLTSEKRRQLGMIIKSNYYTTTTKMKTILEEKYQTFNVSDRTIRRELSHLGYISILPRKVSLLTQKAKTNRLLRHVITSLTTGRKLFFRMKQLSRCFAIRCWHGLVKKSPPNL